MEWKCPWLTAQIVLLLSPWHRKHFLGENYENSWIFLLIFHFRYRAILGPFQWPVWLCLTLTYLLAIIPLAYSDSLSIRYLIENPGQIENMFWYVFGTFTNSLTFSGEMSWSNSRKSSTRILIGKVQNSSPG